MFSDEVTVWAICGQYFLYKTEGSDENNDCFHMVNLENKNATYLIQDFVKNPECELAPLFNIKCR